MKRTLFIPVVIIVLLVGCRPEENPEQLKAVNKSLEYTNGVIQNANNLIYAELIDKQKDPMTAGIAAVWIPRANKIKQYADSIKAMIKEIKVELIKQSDSLKRDYVDVTKQLHNADGVGWQLLNKLTTFKDSIPAVFYLNEDNRPYIRDDVYHLLTTISLLPEYRDSLTADQKSNYKKKWLEESFGRSSSLMALIMLNKIESDVLAMEHKFISYCNSKVYFFCGLRYEVFRAIAVLSSSYVKAGQSIEVTAGVVSFNEASKPRITINGKEVKVGDDATAIYKFIATGAPGKHTIPVTFEYVKPDGSRGTVWKRCEYVIADQK